MVAVPPTDNTICFIFVEGRCTLSLGWYLQHHLHPDHLSFNNIRLSFTQSPRHPQKAFVPSVLTCSINHNRSTLYLHIFNTFNNTCLQEFLLFQTNTNKTIRQTKTLVHFTPPIYCIVTQPTIPINTSPTTLRVCAAQHI